jgi:glycosyltransferase involved in cell wall biosynthesis
MKILVLTSTFPRYQHDPVPGFVLDFSKNIAEHAEVLVLAPHDKGAKFKEKISGVLVYRFPYFFPKFETLAYRGGMVNKFKESFLAKVQLPFYLVSLLFGTLYLVITKKINIIHAHWLFPQGFVAVIVKILTGKKTIITTHGGDVAILNNSTIRKILKMAITRSDKVTYVSRKNLDIVRAAMGEKSVLNSGVMPMGIYLPHDYYDQPSQQQSKGTKLLFIGRLVKIKGLHVLLQSLSLVLKTTPDLHLTILGDGPEKESLKNTCNELGINRHTSFEGFVMGERKRQFLKESDIVVIPSIVDQYGYEEGLPVAALEALSYGKVLIATKTGGLTELIDGRNGILVEHSNPKELAQAISYIARNSVQRKAIQKLARETAHKYSWEEITTNFLKIVDGITKTSNQTSK